MLIDWFTVAAQALNFLVLVWLLKRFLYKPILGAVAAREKRIADELRDAGAKKAEARQERDAFERKNEEFAQERGALLHAAEEEAKTQRQQLIAEARADADALRKRLQQTLESERASLNDEIAARTQEEVLALTRKALTDLASESLEERVTEVFLRRLRELNGEEAGKLRAQHGAHVRSAFELQADQRNAIQRALNEKLGEQTAIDFETSPALVSGIELTTDGQKIAWSISDYLGSLAKSAGKMLESKNASNE